MGQGLGRDAAASVGYLQPPAVPGGQTAQRNRAARCAGVGGVQHKVAQQVCQQHPVGPHGGVLWAGFFEGHGAIGQAAGHILKGGGHRHGGQGQGFLAQVLQAEQLLAQAFQPGGFMVDGIGGAALVFGRQLAAAQ